MILLYDRRLYLKKGDKPSEHPPSSQGGGGCQNVQLGILAARKYKNSLVVMALYHRRLYLKKRDEPSEHPPSSQLSKPSGGNIGCMYKNSSWGLTGLPSDGTVP